MRRPRAPPRDGGHRAGRRLLPQERAFRGAAARPGAEGLYRTHGIWGLRDAGVERARARLFPEGELEGGPLNPFTGKPMRHGRDPGDAGIVVVDGAAHLRAWSREGKSTDLRLP